MPNPGTDCRSGTSTYYEYRSLRSSEWSRWIDYSVRVSDRGEPITLVTEVITVSAKDYEVYSRGSSTPLRLLVLNT